MKCTVNYRTYFFSLASIAILLLGFVASKIFLTSVLAHHSIVIGESPTFFSNSVKENQSADFYIGANQSTINST